MNSKDLDLLSYNKSMQRIFGLDIEDYKKESKKYLNDEKNGKGKGKYNYDDGAYFIGEYKNGLRNGKGIEYYSNGNIKYDGEWINDEFVEK